MIILSLFVTFLVGITSAEYDWPTCPVNEDPLCAVRCANLLKPICAIPNGWTGEPHTFGNNCTMAGYNCNCRSYPYKYCYDGECRVPGCADACMDIYKPVCALPDGYCAEPKVFGNSCFLSMHNCKEKNKYKHFHDGECLSVLKAASKAV